MDTILRSADNTVIISTEGPVVIIGEKINPTGRKKMQACLQAGDFDYIIELARSQVAAGAQVLDINVGVPGMDDVALMRRVVQLVSEAVDVPLCLDSPNPLALAAGLEVAPGRPLVNSISGEESRLASVLPLVKERGAAVIGLIMDDSGVPATPEGRLAVAGKIIERAAKMGIPAEDIIIDPLAMAVGADSEAGLVTLKTIELIRREFGNNITMGASNVSFGLPERPTLNAAFMALAIHAGATCAITDPAKLAGTIRAVDLLLGRDEYSMEYIRWFRKSQALNAAQAMQEAVPAI
jgi:5-methyltetrahydrofolate--homocysteine methyltransferase